MPGPVSLFLLPAPAAGDGKAWEHRGFGEEVWLLQEQTCENSAGTQLLLRVFL